MGKAIISNLKFKKYVGKFDPAVFGQKLDDAYLATKRPDGEIFFKQALYICPSRST